MSRSVIPLSSPYRNPGRPVATPRGEPADALDRAQKLANGFVLGWALLRIAVCTVKGLDLEGFLALVIVVTAVMSAARSLA
jgi:short subunit fatty acids transporter